VQKVFSPDASNQGVQEEKFWREVNAYQAFADLAVDFVPRLLTYDDSEYSLTIEKIDGGDLCVMLERGNDFDIEETITQLITIDTFLYDKRINYLHSSPKDIIYEKNKNRLYIVDFEYTVFNSYFSQILFDRMFHNRMMRVENMESRDRFLSALQRRKKDFKLYHYRKLKNALLTRLGFIPTKHT
jgi:hypothetical protein